MQLQSSSQPERIFQSVGLKYDHSSNTWGQASEERFLFRYLPSFHCVKATFREGKWEEDYFRCLTGYRHSLSIRSDWFPSVDIQRLENLVCWLMENIPSVRMVKIGKEKEFGLYYDSKPPVSHRSLSEGSLNHLLDNYDGGYFMKIDPILALTKK